MKKYRVLIRRDNGRIKEMGRHAVPLLVPIAELVAAAREGMRGLSRGGIKSKAIRRCPAWLRHCAKKSPCRP